MPSELWMSGHMRHVLLNCLVVHSLCEVCEEVKWRHENLNY